jgi:beta-galactosidase
MICSPITGVCQSDHITQARVRIIHESNPHIAVVSRECSIVRTPGTLASLAVEVACCPTRYPSVRRIRRQRLHLMIPNLSRLETRNARRCVTLLGSLAVLASPLMQAQSEPDSSRERISINDGWTFFKYAAAHEADDLIYDVRPEIVDSQDGRPADAKPTEAVGVTATRRVLKPWILPTGNAFIADPAKRYARPEGDPGSDFPFVQPGFDDGKWERINLPHDWAIKGPFYAGPNPAVGGGMGRLPSPGVAWYRRKLDIPATDAGRSIFLDVDGAMSYAMVWLNGHLVGGWPFGYSSWRVDLTPYVVPGGENQLAIRLDNPRESSRWYPGGGIYRNVWLTKTAPVHVGQWGTFITTREVSAASATVDIEIRIDNRSATSAAVDLTSEIFALDANGRRTGDVVASFVPCKTSVPANGSTQVASTVTLANPRLWGPLPNQTPHRYVAVTTLTRDGAPVDSYETRFGIREVRFDPDDGIFVNGERIPLRGVNQHHDLGALGAAFNMRAAERQLEILGEMGCNAVRMSHNPPAPELLELTDRMGFLVIDETFDSWERRKTPHDFHLIFPDWHEQDTRAMVRRDRNNPSVILWSIGNEVGEQYTDEAGAAVARRLRDITRDEDPTRPTMTAMNWAKSDMPLPAVVDVIGLNYQGEGIRQDPEFEGTERIRTPPQYPFFHARFPGKVIISTETASAASSRGVYLFPVSPQLSAPIRDGRGGDSKINHVSSYELHAVDFGSTADKVFGQLDRHPYVAGEFVWNGFDYIGEPTPYYSARSSYTGMFDLAGFPKDRFYLYQARWRPDMPMAHILPHWNWPDRVGQVTPVHVFTSGDEAELFLNGRSLGRKRKGQYEYRLRWDEAVYEPGELKVVAYKDGTEWATEVVRTTGTAAALAAEVDRPTLLGDGEDLAFVTVRVTDREGLTVPTANNTIRISIHGPGDIVATDNGDPTDFTPFPSHERSAFSGLCIAIIRTRPGESGTITVRADSRSLRPTIVTIQSVVDR